MVGLVNIFVILLLIRSKKITEDFFMALFINALAAFLFLTKMHERYLAPALPFLALSAASHRRLWPIFAAISLSHLANLYHEWWFPRIPILVNWLSSWAAIQLMAATITTSTIITLTYFLKIPQHET